MSGVRADQVVLANPRCLLTELGDGTGVILDLDSKFYFTLNAAGVVVWKALSGSTAGADASVLCRKLVEHFEVEHDAAMRDVLGLLGELAGEGLVR